MTDREMVRLLNTSFRQDSDYTFKFNHEHRDGTRHAHDITDLCPELRVLPSATTLDHDRLRASIVSIDPKKAGRFTIGDLSQFTDALLARLSEQPGGEQPVDNIVTRRSVAPGEDDREQPGGDS